jgi:hypothetical protein
VEHLLKQLPPIPRSALVRLANSTGLVAFCFVLVIGMQRDGLLAFYILLPAVFAASCSSVVAAGSMQRHSAPCCYTCW